MFKKRNISTANASSKKKLAPISDSESGSDEDVVKVAKNSSRKFKKLKLNTVTDKKNDITGQVDYATTGNSQLSKGTDATKRDRLLAEDEEAYRISLQNEESAPTLLDIDDGEIYKGQKAYTNFADPTKSSSKNSNHIGPMKSASSIRTTTTFDFQPDVCKDFKQTGYCGYGDTCKFLHLRDDAKKGWKMTREWEGVGKSKSKFDEKKLENIPFKCPICKKDYQNPIITPCQHYFCQRCYLSNYKEKKSCFICGKNTGGSMVIAKDLKKLLLLLLLLLLEEEEK